MASSTITEQLPLVGTTRITFYDVANEIVEFFHRIDEFSRQQKIMHLGKISEVISCLNHTRYEYLLLQCFFSDIFENTYKGTPIALGTISIGQTEYPGNAIIKSWFLLSNFGHSMNTIADERTLLVFSNERRGFRNNLLSTISDENLREYASDVINNLDYMNFHHILSIWRIEKELSRNRTLKDKLFLLYKMLLLDNYNYSCNLEKLRSLRSIYKILRYISIIALDSHNAHLPFSLNLLSTLTSIDIYEKRFKPRTITKILYPLLSILYEEIYLDRDVLCKTREYEVNALNYCKSKNANYQTYNQLIIKSLREGLIDEKKIELQHFTRYSFSVDLKFESNLLNEFRHISTVKRNCQNVEYSLDFNPISRTKYIDYFLTTEFNKNEFPRLCFNITSIFETQLMNYARNKNKAIFQLVSDFRSQLDNLGVDESIVNSIIGSSTEESYSRILTNLINTTTITVRELISSIIAYFINPKYTLEIKSHKEELNNIGIKLNRYKIDNIETNINQLIDSTANLDRKHELLQTKKSATRTYHGFVLCYLSRIDIYDLSLPPKDRIVTDIDSVVIKFCENCFKIEFHEAKNQNRNSESSAVRDLKRNIIPILNEHAVGRKIQKIKNSGAKIVIRI